MHSISIIIRTLNESRHLGRLLDVIQSQQHAGLTHEVVVVDSGSSDGTLDIARRHGCRLLTIRRDEFSFGRSLNIGCEAAQGDYLVFISGHCIPTNDQWLCELTRPLIDGRASYSYGKQIGGDTTQFSERQIFAKYFPDADAIPQQELYCNNANAALLRSAWSRYRFDEGLTGLEDLHLAKRLMEAGQNIAYTARACVHHLHDESWEQVERRFEREALALQRIMPEVHIRQRDVFRYIASSIWGDAKKARAEKTLTRSIRSIVLYRIHQYLGSYRGNRVHQELSHVQKERYFYPDRSKHQAASPRLEATEIGRNAPASATSDD